MRILVVSDIHANFEALRRMPDDVDCVLCIGDLVDYGPDPVPCIEWVRARSAATLRGNHDHAVAFHVDCRCSPVAREASEATREVMWQALGPRDIDFLATLPLQTVVKIGGVRFHLVHATPSDPLYTYLRPTDEARWAAEVEDLDADVVLTGHTHLPMILHVGGKVVVNPGSVGQPAHGDPRAAFAIIEDGEPRLMRVEYDVEASIGRLARMGLRDPVFGQLAGLLRTGRPRAHPV